MARSHKVDIQGLLGAGRQLLLVDDEVRIESFEGIAFPNPARVHLEIRCVDRILAVRGSVAARAVGRCDACLEDVERAIAVDVEERLDPAIRREDDPLGEGNVLTGGRLDVADLAQQVVLSVLPMGLRCSDDCQGLCGICGANRNAGRCSCENGEIRGKSKMEDAAQ
ncbi:MAG TPA: DUF177 domain-containing protein [Candidatus Tumulicola sp.]|jgi:uncharacterized protein